jgi:predicted enzyme related to lactoylglutathione lyase
VIPLPRLRQVALAAHDLHTATKALEDAFGWPEPFHDPGVAEFGLENSVFTSGDTFVEVVSPARDGTAAGRYLERRGGDSGYMAIFQVEDLAAARSRVADAGMRVVWKVDLPDIAGTHLHPKETPGAIVSLDWADPPGTWRWAGPGWTGTTSPNSSGPITALEIEVKEPAVAAQRWATALGLVAVVDSDGRARVELSSAGQVLSFVPAGETGAEGITEVWLQSGVPVERTVEIAGVRFVVAGGGITGDGVE